MKPRTFLRALAGLTLICFAALTVSVATSPAAHSKGHHKTHKKTHYKNVYWIDLGGSASRAPKRVFFTANAGGFVKNLKWSGWGTRKAVGRGQFGTTAPCNGQPCPKGWARLVMREPVVCHPEFGSKQGKAVRVYRHATLYYPDGSKRRVTSVVGTSGILTCKESY